MKKIIITGGDGRFAKVLKHKFSGKNIFYFSKKELDVTKFKLIKKKIKKIKPKIILHLAALSKPLDILKKISVKV